MDNEAQKNVDNDEIAHILTVNSYIVQCEKYESILKQLVSTSSNDMIILDRLISTFNSLMNQIKTKKNDDEEEVYDFNCLDLRLTVIHNMLKHIQSNMSSENPKEDPLSILYYLSLSKIPNIPSDNIESEINIKKFIMFFFRSCIENSSEETIQKCFEALMSPDWMIRYNVFKNHSVRQVMKIDMDSIDGIMDLITNELFNFDRYRLESIDILELKIQNYNVHRSWLLMSAIITSIKFDNGDKYIEYLKTRFMEILKIPKEKLKNEVDRVMKEIQI
jgi:hypothetical protein